MTEHHDDPHDENLHDYWTAPADDVPLIEHPDHLHTVWTGMMNDRRPIGSDLVLLVIDPVGRVELCAELEAVPDLPTADPLRSLIGGILEAAPDSSVAMLRVREPSDLPETEGDRVWARTAREVAHELGVRLWPMHTWTGGSVRLVLPPDRGVA